ncbi:hypothetical protein LR48_Vigan03g083000 [Vigna angularis]|uniref:Uncharacterized protein n=1 Tax=Phaseolus angularis TaxID=3914 RepID=A0A0L9U3S1_PHAAN|nr:hypothetical protein LR48_Vigan03g083000 [Vigna angularis]
MKNALRGDTPLPYLFLVTLFMEHFEIPLDDGKLALEKKKFTIEADIIFSFGFHKNRDGQWVHKDAPTHRQCPLPPQHQPPTLQQDTYSLDDIMNGICDLRAFIDGRDG